MRHAVLLLALCSTLALEAWSMYLAVSWPYASHAWPIAAAIHVFSCWAFAWTLGYCLPPSHRKGVTALALLGVFMPFVGLTGIGIATLVGLQTRQEPERKTSCLLLDLPEATPLSRAPGRSIAAIEGLLRAHGSTETRISAVVALGDVPARHAVPLLKLALKDPADEVRLLALARLEKIQEQIEEEIAASRSALAHGPPGTTAEHHQRLAEAYGELAYLGLAEGEACRHALQNAADHAQAAGQLSPRFAGLAQSLLGRIRLKQGRAREAVYAFRQAMASGIPSRKLAPYMAEAAFHSSDTSTVRAWIHLIDGSRTNHPPLSRLTAFWR